MRPEIDVVIGIILRDGRVLVCQRPADTTFPDYWEFPGGKREPGESLDQCLARELYEELAIAATPFAALDRVEYDYATARVRLHPYVCTLAAGEPRPLACQRFEWIDPSRLRDLQFPAANEALIDRVIEQLAGPPAASIGDPAPSGERARVDFSRPTS